MFIAYLLLGSNLGDRIDFLTRASHAIKQGVGKISASSAFYCTASWGKQNQPDFLNQVLAVETVLKPDELLKEVLRIELDLGRERNERWGSRTIDIDILFYGNEIIDMSDLKIPHPLLHKRRFCLEPLCEIVPKLIHPVLGKNVKQLLAELGDNLSVKKLP